MADMVNMRRADRWNPGEGDESASHQGTISMAPGRVRCWPADVTARNGCLMGLVFADLGPEDGQSN
jgi:hypothetical protein